MKGVHFEEYSFLLGSSVDNVPWVSLCQCVSVLCVVLVLGVCAEIACAANRSKLSVR